MPMRSDVPDTGAVLLDPRDVFRVASAPDQTDPPEDPRMLIRNQSDPLRYQSSGVPLDRGYHPPAPVVTPPAPPIVIQSHAVPTLIPVLVDSSFSLSDVPWWGWAGIAGVAYFMLGGRRGR